MNGVDLLLVLGGAVAGFVNTLAGAGSALTLPLLMFAGLDAGVANGTNRVGVVAQAASGALGFHAQNVRPWGELPRVVVPAVAGALLGAVLVSQVPAGLLERVFGGLFLLLAVVVVARPRWLLPGAEQPAEAIDRRGMAGLFAVGVYGGLVQAGVGLPLLIVLARVTGGDLIRANALKAGVVLCFTVSALAIFAMNGQVAWREGALLAAGGLVGSAVGARATVLKGAPLVRRVLALALVVAGVRSLGLL
jgi:uncharacterized protein